MFSSFQHSNDVFFHTPLTDLYQQHYLDSPLITTTAATTIVGGVPTPSDNKLTPPQRKVGRKRSNKNLQGNEDQDQLIMDNDGNNEKKKKKMMEHREIERKRRQDMANLCSTLRSLFPLHFIKGRRSMTEHMNQAVNYIKHLQENIEGLNTKREELKRIYKVADHSSHVVLKKNSSESDCNRHPNTVMVGYSHGGIEILIKSYNKNEGFLISRVMKALLQEGLNVLSCNSTKVNERFIHSIQSEVIDETTCIQVSVLQQKLAELVNTT